MVNYVVKNSPDPWVAFLVSLMPYSALILVGAISLALKRICQYHRGIIRVILGAQFCEVRH